MVRSGLPGCSHKVVSKPEWARCAQEDGEIKSGVVSEYMRTLSSCTCINNLLRTFKRPVCDATREGEGIANKQSFYYVNHAGPAFLLCSVFGYVPQNVVYFFKNDRVSELNSLRDAKQKHPHECNMFIISSFYFLMSGILLMSTEAASFLKSAVTIKSYFAAMRVKQTQSIIQYC